MKPTLLAVVAMLAAGAAHAQVYKCVDASGKTVYSQNPCPANTKSEMMSRGVMAAPSSTPSSAPSGDPAKDAGKASGPASLSDQNKAFQKRQADQQEAAQKDAQKLADAKLKEENCARTRGYMQSLQGGRVSTTNEAGERSFLDDNQIAAEMAKAQAQVDQYCSK